MNTLQQKWLRERVSKIDDVILNFESVANVDVRRAYFIGTSDILLAVAATTENGFGLLSVSSTGRVSFEKLEHKSDYMETTQMKEFGVDFPQESQT